MYTFGNFFSGHTESVVLVDPPTFCTEKSNLVDSDKSSPLK